MTRDRVLADWACALYVALDVAVYAYTQTAGASLNRYGAASQVGVLLLDVLLVLAARRRSWAWVALLVLNGFVLLGTVMAAVAWDWYVIGLAAFLVAQLAVLVAGRRPARERVPRDAP